MSRQPYIYDNAAPGLESEEKPRNWRIAKRPSEKQPRRAPELKHSLGDVFRRVTVPTVCVACAVMLLDFYVQGERRVRQAEPARGEIQRKFDEQKEVNDALQMKLNQRQGLKYIRDLAINRYSLIQPEPGQVIYYDRAKQGYVRQYEEVPKGTKSGK